MPIFQNPYLSVNPVKPSWQVAVDASMPFLDEEGIGIVGETPEYEVTNYRSWDTYQKELQKIYANSKDEEDFKNLFSSLIGAPYDTEDLNLWFPWVINEYLNVVDYAQKYINSPRHKELLQKQAIKSGNQDFRFAFDKSFLNSIKPVVSLDKSTMFLGDTIFFNPYDDDVTLQKKPYDYIGFNIASTLGHEFAHTLKERLQIKRAPVHTRFGTLSAILPPPAPWELKKWGYDPDWPFYLYLDQFKDQLSQNKAFQEVKLNTGDPELDGPNAFRHLKTKYYYMPAEEAKKHNITTRLAHDGDVNELYADLFALRYELYRLGIYDSLKLGVDISEKAIKKYLKRNPDLRLITRFGLTAKQIANMLNTIAQQENRQLNEYDLQYARKGLKLIPRKRYGNF